MRGNREEQEQAETRAEAGKASQATGHREGQAVQPVGVSVFRYDKDRGER